MKINIEANIKSIVFFLEEEVVFRGIKQNRSLFLYNMHNTLISASRFEANFFTTKINFFIKLSNSKEEFTMKYTSLWRPVLYGNINNDQYQTILHLGLKSSFFCNDKQIGYLEQQPFHMGTSGKFILIADDNVDIELLCTLTYLIISIENLDDADLNLSIGRIGFELRKFDYNWKPITAHKQN